MSTAWKSGRVTSTASAYLLILKVVPNRPGKSEGHVCTAAPLYSPLPFPTGAHHCRVPATFPSDRPSLRTSP